MSTDDGRNALIAAIDAKLGGTVHCLVNNVGSNIRKRAIEYTEPEYEHIMRTNLKSAFSLTTKLYPQLKKAAMASVVNIGSVAGMLGSLIYCNVVIIGAPGAPKVIQFLAQDGWLRLLCYSTL
jgi:Tropinone reductase 1